MEEKIKTKRQIGFFILLDNEDKEKVETIKNQLDSIEDICLSKIDSVDEEKVFAEIESLDCSISELAERIINKTQFNGVINIYDGIVTDDSFSNTISLKTFLKGNPITQLALVLFNDKNKDYCEALYQILLNYNCFNISIEALVSEYERKYFLAKFDTISIDFSDLYNNCQKVFPEEIQTSINRNNKFDYEEMLLKCAEKSMPPIPMCIKTIKQNNFFDFSGDDLSLDPRMW